MHLVGFTIEIEKTGSFHPDQRGCLESGASEGLMTLCVAEDVSANNEAKVGRCCLVFALRPGKCYGSDAMFLKKHRNLDFIRPPKCTVSRDRSVFIRKRDVPL